MTQDKVSKWIQLLHKHPAHLHALGIKDAQPQRDPGIQPLAGLTIIKLTDKCNIKRNKIRNQITLLRGQTEEGVAFFLDKIEETINTCDNLLLTWRTHGKPLGDRKVKEIMYETATKILEEIEQWRDNSSTEDTLDSLTSMETLIIKIHEMNHAILKEEEDAATEFSSLLKLLIKKINMAHLHALGIKDAQPQRDPGIQPLAGMTITKLTDKYIIKPNKIRNQITFLRGQTEEGAAFFLDKIEETIDTCDNLLLTWRTHGKPLGDRKVKETMYETATKILEEIEQWRDNSNTEDTLDSLTSVETLITKIHEMNHAILRSTGGPAQTGSDFVPEAYLSLGE